ncbi:MAG TPA: hypothetical protein VGM78_10220 [Ilumatobacteraceae bacterium]
MSRVIVDVGEQSTSLHSGAEGYVIPCGSGSLRARHFTSDPPQPADLTNAIGETMDHLDDAKRAMPSLDVPRADDDDDEADTFVLAGRLAQVIAAVEHGGSIDADTFSLSRDAAEDVFRTVATEARADRRHNPGLPAAAVDDIVGACCVVVALFRGLHLDHVVIDLADEPAGHTASHAEVGT